MATPSVIYDLRRAVAWTRAVTTQDIRAAAGMDLVTHVILPVRRTLDRQWIVIFGTEVNGKQVSGSSLAPLRAAGPTEIVTLVDALQILRDAGKGALVRVESQWQAASPDWDTHEKTAHELLRDGEGVYAARAYNPSRTRAAAEYPGQWRLSDSISDTTAEQVGHTRDATGIAIASTAVDAVWQQAASMSALVVRPTSVEEARAAQATAQRLGVEVEAWLVRDQEHVRAIVAPAVPEREASHGEVAWEHGAWHELQVEGRPVQRIEVVGHEQERVGVVPYGAATWRGMLRDHPDRAFHVAHRGGSESWHEHTMLAYSQSVARGVEALEISCHRTRDGVWVASHDASLARVGGPTQNVADLTYEQIRAHFAAQAPDRMPATLQQLLSAYGRSHVIVADPKGSAAQVDGMLDLLRPYAERVMIKFFWDAQWLFRKVKSITPAFGTWAYAYNASATDPTWQQAVTDGYVDVMAIEWSAPSAMWQHVVQSDCVPVGHITTDPAHVAAARVAGARGVMDAAPGATLQLRL